jgi:two-component system, OmpR family, response regulator MprA
VSIEIAAAVSPCVATELEEALPGATIVRGATAAAALLVVEGDLEAVRRLRAAGDPVPVLVLSPEGVDARIDALDAGADDCLAQPFEHAELVARVRALLRRTELDESRLLRAGEIELDLRRREARRDGRLLDLTTLELRLLELLARNRDQVLTRSLIADRIWEDSVPSSNSLEVCVASLRRKLEEDGAPRLLHTERGIGYVLRTRVACACS